MAAAMTKTVYNVALTTQNTEYSQALPADVRRIRFQARGSVDIRYAFETGKVATPTAPYMTLKSGQVYDWTALEGQFLGTITLYFAAGSNTQVAEVETWS